MVKNKFSGVITHYINLIKIIESDPILSNQEKTIMKTNALEKADLEILTLLSSRSREI